MPPARRLSATPWPTSRALRYCSCASSTCSLPSALVARWAKISRISAVRSITFTRRISSRLRTCTPVSSSSMMHTSASSAWQSRASSSARPLPMNRALSGLSRFCRKIPATSAPAVSARRRSSSRDSSLSMPISTAFSRPSSTAAVSSRPTSRSLSSIWSSHSASGSRYHRAGGADRISPPAPRNAVCAFTGSPSRTPTAVIAS